MRIPSRVPSSRRTLALAAAAISSLLTSPAAHATYTWTNSAIGFWNDPANWTSGVPDSANDAAVANGGLAFVTGGQNAHDLSISGNSVVEAYSSADYGYGALTFHNATVYSGALDLAADDGYQTIVTATGSIDVRAGAQLNLFGAAHGDAYYTVNGQVDNAGAVYTGAYSTFTSSVVNSGTFTVGGQNIAAIYQAGFYQTAGTLNVTDGSTLHVSIGAFALTGGAISNSGYVTDTGAPTGAAGAILLTGGCSLLTTIADGGGAVINAFNNVTLVSDLPAHTNLMIASSASSGYGSLGVSPGFTNRGNITLRADDGYVNSINVGPIGSGAYTNAGTINITTTGAANTADAYLNGALTNTGDLNSAVNTYFNATTTNTGAMNLSNGASFNSTGITFNQNGGTLGNTGASSLNMTGGTFNLNGGRVYLTVNLSGTTRLNLNVSDGQGLVFNAAGSVTLGTAFRANTTLNLNAGASYGYSTLNVNDNASNFGHIFLHAYDGYIAAISAGGGAGNFNNAGLLEFNTNGNGNNGSAVLGGTFVNTSVGTVNTDVNLTFGANASNSGSFNVGNGATLYMTNARFNQDGGNLGNSGQTHFAITNGGFNLNGGTLGLTVDFHGDSYVSTSVFNAGGAAFNFFGGNAAIHGNLSPGANVFTVASASNGYANLYVDAGAENFGSITLSVTDGYTNNLYVGDGSNSSSNNYSNYGTLTYNASSGSSIGVGGNVINYGTLNASGKVTIQGTFSNNGGAALNVNGANSSIVVNGDILVGGHIVAQGGGNIVGQGGGNIVGQGGGNIISQDGNSIIAVTGGGSVISNDGGTVISNDGGTVISNDGGTVISNDGGTFIAENGGFIKATFVGHNGSSAPGGVIMSPAASGPADPAASIIARSGGTFVLHGGILVADNVFQISAGAHLTGYGSATAASALSAGTLSPTGGAITLNAPLTLSGGSITGDSPLIVTQSVTVTAPITLSGSPTLHPTAALTISSGSSLDLTGIGASLMLDKSAGYSLTSVRQLLTASQVISTTAASDAQNRLTIATVDTGLSLLARLTYFGDANLDGKINADDFVAIDRAFARQDSATWTAGDFNADGLIDNQDYLLIDRVYLQQGGAMSPATLAEREAQFGETYITNLLGSVPEPSMISMLLAAPLLKRRRTRDRQVANSK